jgi:hypothetical protein
MTHLRTATDPIVILGKRGVHDHAVRRAMLEVDRALFVAPEEMAVANEDRPITVGEGHSVIARDRLGRKGADHRRGDRLRRCRGLASCGAGRCP